MTSYLMYCIGPLHCESQYRRPPALHRASRFQNLNTFTPSPRLWLTDSGRPDCISESEAAAAAAVPGPAGGSA